MEQYDRAYALGIDEIVELKDDEFENIDICLLLKHGELVARGISICSLSDKYNEELARIRAVGRAIQALVHKRNRQKIRPRGLLSGMTVDESIAVNTRLIKLQDKYGSKGMYRPYMSDYEWDFVDNVKIEPVGENQL